MNLQRRQFLHLAAGSAAQRRADRDKLTCHHFQWAVGGTMPSLVVIAALALLAVASMPATAQSWPTRPVTMVFPFAPGNGGEILGRLFASRLSEILGQPVLFENVGGGGGTIGAARVAKATPDGYQFLLGTVSNFALHQAFYLKPPYNAATDFAPVALIAETPLILLARKDLPANDLREFIVYAKANQAKMQFGSGGLGTSSHLACVLLNTAIGVNITHIPYRGGAQAVQDLIAGRLDYQCVAPELAAPQVQGNQAKAIAILTKSRSPILQNLASAHEQGLADFEAAAWLAFAFPKGTPSVIVQRLHDATVATMNTPGVRERLTEIGEELVAPERRSPEYLQQFIGTEIEKWGRAVTAANIRAE
jgi:tripartite-type tricarboxylate transporter receptor subunit TctC